MTTEPEPEPEPERISLLTWMRENPVSDKWSYKAAATHQMCFFRDRVAPLFFPPALLVDDEPAYSARQTFCKIDGFHTSKSILLPVYYVETDKVVVVARNNFYNWNVTVVSKVDIELPAYFDIDGLSHYLFLEGMEQWKRSRYADPDSCRRQFSFAVNGDHQLYAILWCISACAK